jgi:PAS domain S-box-containing protein/putative nucleotidyltransferase with HDIG domain
MSSNETPRWYVAVISAVLFSVVLSFRLVNDEVADGMLVLFVIPIAICAMEFGLRGGLLAAGGAVVLLIVYELAFDASELGAFGITTRAIACIIVGVLLGRLADQRRGLQVAVERHFSRSLDLFCTARFDGVFDDLNPAFEQTLGYSREELRSRPFLDFVHPDDQEATRAEFEKLASGIDTRSFRNRYRTAEGDYRWIEWNVHPDLPGRKVYATGRDITAQAEAEATLSEHRERLERTVRERTRDLEESRLEVLRRLAVVAEYRDDDTSQHTERVGRTAARIARRMGFSDEDVELIRRAAPLHDIGKVGVPDAILMKRDTLTPDEFGVMQEHVHIGSRVLSHGKFPVLHVARTIALSHHERWDGTGYPYRLAGEDIPLVGRITAVADVFDALTQRRPYKPAWPIAEAVTEIERGAGTQFDPDVVAAFLELEHARLLHPVRGVRAVEDGPGRPLAAART